MATETDCSQGIYEQWNVVTHKSLLRATAEQGVNLSDEAVEKVLSQYDKLDRYVRMAEWSWILDD